MTVDLILGVAIGTVFGFFITILFNKLKGGEDSMKLNKLKADHEQYRKKVDNHFVNTSILFKGLTEQYRDVYRHIAEGAGELCSEEAKAIQVDMEEPALLAQQATENATIVSAGDSKTDSATEQHSAPARAIDDDEIPLASEVEMTPEIADEIKNHSSHK